VADPDAADPGGRDPDPLLGQFVGHAGVM
jgi:hypothetical protein